MDSLKQFFSSKICIPILLILALGIYFLCVYRAYSTFDFIGNRNPRLIPWAVNSWNPRNNLQHGYLMPFIFIIMTVVAYRRTSTGEGDNNKRGLIIGAVFVVIGLLCYLISIRCIQPRVALIGLPFLISGCWIFAIGWNKGKYFIFPSFILYFAVPVPGLNQLTNGLQVIVTGWCYNVGNFIGMDLLRVGNTISSANGKWDGFNIAEGCSGIKSLMALIMIAAIYAYYSGNKWWKKVLLFSAAFPLALVGNFFRIFTILVIAEMGFVEFAKDTYHDWAGLLIFFPLALGGLLIFDKLLNYKKRKTVSRIIE